jgi:transmembrane sensor
MEEEHYINLLRDFVAGQISDDDKHQLIEWLQSVEGRACLDRYMSDAWMRAESSMDAKTQLRMLKNLKERINKTNKPSHKLAIRWMSYAAAAAILIIGTFTVTSHLMEQKVLPKSDATCQINVDKGHRANMVLPDGTQVFLNSDSHISYQRSYGDSERRVKLSGEAYFDVAKDKEHKFIVNANGVNVEALGTAFDVNAYPENKNVITTLFRGKVRVSTDQGSVVLNPNEDVAVNTSTNQFTHHYLSGLLEASLWRQGQLAINHKTLAEIADIINRTYNMNVIIRNQKIRNYRFTGVIRDNNLNNLLDMLTITSHTTYTIKNNTITFDEK